MNVLVIAKTDKLAINVIRCLRMSGMTAHLMCSESILGARFSRYCSSWIKLEAGLFDSPFTEAIARINDCCKRQEIDVVMGVDLPAIRMLSAIQSGLTHAKVFPVAKPDQLWMLDNKWSFFQFLREYHLPVPKTVLVESTGQLDELEKTGLRFPLIVKPVQLEDGIGVRKLYSLADARAHVLEDRPAHRLPLLFQEFIPGTDVDLSILADNGVVLAWTIQKWLSDGTLAFVDDGHVLDLGRKMAAAARFHGVAHFDMRRDERDGSVKILECNPRFWATLRESMWNGTNFVDQGISLCTGKPAAKLGLNQQIVYTFPSRALASLAKGDFSVLKRLSAENLQDAWQTISDPLPLAHKFNDKFSRKRRERIQAGS